MLHILFTQERILSWNPLVNAEGVILDADATISLWCIEVVALVLEEIVRRSTEPDPHDLFKLLQLF